MALAVVVWSDGYMQRLRDEDKAIALEAYDAWKAHADGGTVKRVVLPRSWQPDGYESAIYPEQPSKLTNPRRAAGDERDHTEGGPMKDKILEYVEAAYLHGLPAENFDTGKREAPADIADVAWIADRILALFNEAIGEDEPAHNASNAAVRNSHRNELRAEIRKKVGL
jgi:hypothetical protein